MVFDAVLTGSIRDLIEKIIYVSIIIVVASIIAKVIATGISRFGKKTGIRRDIISLINKAITYFIAFVGIILILQVFNFNIATFVASFGIAGLVIGIGSQAIISNFISGILVMIEKPFVIGDFIDITGLQGVVEDISLRSTSIKTFDGRWITIPNSIFTSNAIVNYSRTGGILVKIPVSFTADIDIDKVSQIMSQAAKNTYGVSPYHIEVLVTGITQDPPSWNVQIELRFWVDQIIDKDIVVSNVTGRIKEELAKEEIITVPPPQEED